MIYKTGQRFKAKILDTPVEGKILVLGGHIHLCNNTKYLKRNYDTLGYNGSWFFIKDNGYILNYTLNYWKITDLELLPDQEEPVAGDEVEVSMNEDIWYENHIYTGYKSIHGHLTDKGGVYASWKHIRKPKPKPTLSEIAKKKAIKWLKTNRPDIMHYEFLLSESILTEYILHILKTEGK